MWTHTKRQTDRALGPPKALLARLHRGSQEVTDDSDDDVEGRSLPDYRWASQACDEPMCLEHSDARGVESCLGHKRTSLLPDRL